VSLLSSKRGAFEQGHKQQQGDGDVHCKGVESAQELSQFGALKTIRWGMEQQDWQRKNRCDAEDHHPRADSKWHPDLVTPCAGV
jgi:hypothetical protein